MSFLSLSPAMAGLLLAATAAMVVILYWLKPPPKRVVVPSNILWNRLMREKKKQTFLDRLRWWISLLVAIAIGLSVAMALARPEFGGVGDEARDITQWFQGVQRYYSKARDIDRGATLIERGVPRNLMHPAYMLSRIDLALALWDEARRREACIRSAFMRQPAPKLAVFRCESESLRK